MTVFVAVQAPELVSRDLRSRVLPLYFARPIKTIDYPLAKYLAFTGACLVMLEVPLLLLYGGSIANVHGGAAVWAQTRALIPGLLVGLMWAVVLAAISLFLARLTGRRAFATGAVAIFFLLTYTLAEILLQVESQPPGVAARSRQRPAGAGPGGGCSGPSLAEKVSGLFSPFTLFDGVRMWLRRHRPGRQRAQPRRLRRRLRPRPRHHHRRCAWPAWPPATGRRACHDRHRDQATSAAGTATWSRSTTSRWTSAPASPGCSARTARASPRSCT